MATRARIGIKVKSGKIFASYQHWDGYPGGLGYTLINHWTDPVKTKKGILLGGASKWGQIIGKKINFDNRENEMYDIQNVYYGRDRGEQDQDCNIYKNEKEYIKRGFNSGEQYVYLMKEEGEKDYLGRPQGTWYYVESTYTKEGKEVFDKEFKPLEEVAIREHCESWNRYLKDKKERQAA
jgi:hypothetical protein